MEPTKHLCKCGICKYLRSEGFIVEGKLCHNCLKTCEELFRIFNYDEEVYCRECSEEGRSRWYKHIESLSKRSEKAVH